MKYDKTIDEVATLQISDNNIATMSMDEIAPVMVQLANDAEVAKLIKEFEDADGELCHEPDAIMTKYTEFHPFRP